ncbi:uncharacterized protein flap isoform X5 [Drosophila pseudoobscura]|uniref:Uncharacterized protein flap isoform X5 n=1 Tax=Drosophila pseudoobscura pseudoobscura TaxID=46245 RepID=A0A6I8VGI4_DROPS|nr:uncharacterized protein LOC4805712 isoform X5 [Drosophila pseudoobscura]
MQIKMKRPQGGGDSSASITATLMLLLLSVHAAIGRPDVRPSPFALELQPPLAQTAEAFNVAGVGGQRSVDSYGNPIAGLRPIDTPDGRKVVSAQGLQFEIPTYASGITDIRQPADDLLPPHIALFDPQGIQSAVQNQAPKAVTEDQFPPFNAGSSTEGVTKKVEYTKSDEGKVISTPISAQRKDTSTPPSNTGKYTGGFGAPAGLLRPQAPGTSGSGSGANTNPGAANSPDSSAGTYVAGNQHEFSNTLKANRARPTVNPGRYTGGFGAPNGVLSVQAEPRPFQQPQQTQQPDSPSHSSRFGGPPGVLVPFDNVQRAGGQ